MYERTEIIGHLGADPEMRYTPAGVPVTNFSIAVTRRWKDQNGNPQEKTKWVRVTAWRKLAEICNEHLSKGRLVFVVGDVTASAWMGQDGEPRATIELTAEKVIFLGGRRETGDRARGPRPSPASAYAPGPTSDGLGEEDDLPF